MKNTRHKAQITVSEKELQAVNRLFVEERKAGYDGSKSFNQDATLAGNVMARLARSIFLIKQRGNGK